MRRMLIASLACIFMCCSANAETGIEIGLNTVNGNSTESITLLVQQRWRNRYALGLGFMTAQKLDYCGRPGCQWDIPEQLMVGFELLFPWRRMSFDVGAYYIQHVHRISSANLNARLSFEYAVTDRFNVKLSHISNARTGRKMTVCSEVACISDKFNMGLDSLLLVWRFD